MKDKKQEKEVPLFARFLERQQYPKVKTKVKAGDGGGDVTLKFPSDDAPEIVIPWP